MYTILKRDYCKWFEYITDPECLEKIQGKGKEYVLNVQISQSKFVQLDLNVWIIYIGMFWFSLFNDVIKSRAH